MAIINFEGGKTYMIYPISLIDKFWPSKWEKKLNKKVSY